MMTMMMMVVVMMIGVCFCVVFGLVWFGVLCVDREW